MRTNATIYRFCVQANGVVYFAYEPLRRKESKAKSNFIQRICVVVSAKVLCVCVLLYPFIGWWERGARADWVSPSNFTILTMDANEKEATSKVNITTHTDIWHLFFYVRVCERSSCNVRFGFDIWSHTGTYGTNLNERHVPYNMRNERA